MKSDNVRVGMQQAPHRSLFNALGMTKEEMERPLVGIVCSYNEIVPGHMNLEKKATVASTTPGPMMGFISENFVSIPPVKRIIHKAIIPTNWVISTERYEMKFKPNNMPTPRNSNSAGAPKRYATLPAITATKSSNAPTNTTFSPLMSIILFRLCYVMLYLLCSAWSAACTPGRRTRTPAWLQNCCRAYGRGPP